MGFVLFESCREKRISLCFMKRLGKLIHFGGRTRLRMKLIAKKELIPLFQITPSRILCDRLFWSYDFLNLFLFFRIFLIFPQNAESSQLKSLSLSLLVCLSVCLSLCLFVCLSVS